MAVVQYCHSEEAEFRFFVYLGAQTCLHSQRYRKEYFEKVHDNRGWPRSWTGRKKYHGFGTPATSGHPGSG